MRSGYFVEWRHLSNRWRSRSPPPPAGGQERQLSGWIIARRLHFSPLYLLPNCFHVEMQPATAYQTFFYHDTHRHVFAGYMYQFKPGELADISDIFRSPISTCLRTLTPPAHLINPFLAQAAVAGRVKIEPTDDKWADLAANG